VVFETCVSCADAGCAISRHEVCSCRSKLQLLRRRQTLAWCILLLCQLLGPRDKPDVHSAPMRTGMCSDLHQLHQCSDSMHLSVTLAVALAAFPADLLNLNLSRNAGVADVALPIVGQQLRWLKQLFLHHTSVTDLGVQWLKQPSLKTVGLCGCKVTQGQLQGWEAVWQNCSWCWRNRR
jgi:hypothetical protein